MSDGKKTTDGAAANTVAASAVANASGNTSTTTTVTDNKEPEVKVMFASEALRQPDGEAVPGKVVTEDSLVRCVHSDMTDNLTKTTYSTASWVNAVPSAWLDGQLRAGKIIVK